MVRSVLTTPLCAGEPREARGSRKESWNRSWLQPLASVSAPGGRALASVWASGRRHWQAFGQAVAFVGVRRGHDPTRTGQPSPVTRVAVLTAAAWRAAVPVARRTGRRVMGSTRFMPRTMLGEVAQTVARGLDLCVAVRERPPAFSDPPSGSRRLGSDNSRTTRGQPGGQLRGQLRRHRSDTSSRDVPPGAAPAVAHDARRSFVEDCNRRCGAVPVTEPGAR